MRKTFYMLIAVILLGGCRSTPRHEDSVSIRELTDEEAAAVAMLRRTHAGQEAYRQQFGSYTGFDMLTEEKLFDAALTEEGVHKRIPTPTNESGVGGDGMVTGGYRSGYVFEMTTWNYGQEWVCIARPKEPDDAGKRCFYIGQTGIIRHVPLNARLYDSDLDKYPALRD